MRGPVLWLFAAGGVLLVLVVGVLIGNRDKSGETVSAGEWAQSVCGAVGVWRGDLEVIVEDIRTPPSQAVSGTEEPQSETPQGRPAFIRDGLEQTIEATETMITAIDNAGVPDTAQGAQSAKAISGWADTTVNDLEDAQDSLDNEADTLAEAIAQLTDAARAITGAVTSGVKAVADVGRTDPELAAALRDSSTCQQLREETTS
jgi:hypothetical protein